MVNNSTASIYYRDITLSMLKGVEYKPKNNTTLNEKFNILPTQKPNDSKKYPSLKYMMIGNGGVNTLFDVLKTSEHTTLDGCLFNPIPFLIVNKSQDLTLEERQKYRLRKETVINSIEYVEYYLKVIDDVPIDNDVFNVINNGETNLLTPFDYNQSRILNPIPRVKEDFITQDYNQYVAITSTIRFYLSVTEMENIKNAIKLKYGETTPVILTELGLCTGIDYTTSSGVESIYTQLALTSILQYDLENMLISNDEIIKAIQIGGLEVLK
jgi:hypothetical protein